MHCDWLLDRMMTNPNPNESYSQVDEETAMALQTAARQGFPDTGVEDVDVVASQDHSGDSVIFVQVKHHLVPRALDLKRILDGDRAVRDAAWQRGERRFVYVQHQYDEKQEVASGR
jgi:hypothetical protein